MSKHLADEYTLTQTFLNVKNYTELNKLCNSNKVFCKKHLDFVLKLSLKLHGYKTDINLDYTSIYNFLDSMSRKAGFVPGDKYYLDLQNDKVHNELLTVIEFSCSESKNIKKDTLSLKYYKMLLEFLVNNNIEHFQFKLKKSGMSYDDLCKKKSKSKFISMSILNV